MANAARLNILVEADAKQLEKELKRVEKRFNDFSRGFRNIGRVLTRSVTLPLAAVAAASLKIAAAAEESENLFEVSMGNMADTARRFSEQISDALGLNAFALRETIGRFNVLFTTLGVGEGVAANMAQRLSVLAADLSSFFDVAQADAFEALQSGLVGQIRPLRRFSVFLTQARVEAFAYENGIASLGEELTEAQKVQARYGLIVQDTQKAQGDLLRAFDSTTNTARRLKEQFDELRIKLGTALLPAFTSLLRLAERTVDRLDKLADAFSSLSPGTQDALVNLSLFTAALGPAFFALGAMADGAKLAVRPVVALGRAFVKTNVGAAALSKSTSLLSGTLTKGGIAGGVGLVAASFLFLKGVFDDITRVTGEARREFDKLIEARDRLIDSPTADPAELQRQLDIVQAQITAVGDAIDRRTSLSEEAIDLLGRDRIRREIQANNDLLNDLFRQAADLQARLQAIQALPTITITVDTQGLTPEAQKIVDDVEAALARLDQRAADLDLSPLERLREQTSLLGSAYEELQGEVEPGAAALENLAARYRTAAEGAAALETAARNANTALKQITTIDPGDLVGILRPEGPLAGINVDDLATPLDDNPASQLQDELNLALETARSFEGAFRNVGHQLVQAMSTGVLDAGNLLKGAFSSILGGVTGSIFGAIGGKIAGGLFPGLFNSTAGASGAGAASTVAPASLNVVVDMSGASLFADPAGEARTPGGQVFHREATLAAEEQGF